MAAVSEKGSAIIRFDPLAGTYDATLTVPTMLSRMGNFSEMLSMGDYSDSSVVYDLIEMTGGAACAPLPNNTVPASREQSPVEVRRFPADSLRQLAPDTRRHAPAVRRRQTGRVEECQLRLVEAIRAGPSMVPFSRPAVPPVLS